MASKINSNSVDVSQKLAVSRVKLRARGLTFGFISSTIVVTSIKN